MASSDTVKARWLGESSAGQGGSAEPASSSGMRITASPHKSPYPEDAHKINHNAHLQSQWTQELHYAPNEEFKETNSAGFRHSHPDEAARATMEGDFISNGERRTVFETRISDQPGPQVSCKPGGSYRPSTRGAPSSASSLFRSARAAVPLLQHRAGGRGPSSGKASSSAPRSLLERTTPLSSSAGGMHQIFPSPTAKAASPYTPRNHRVTNEVSMEVPVRHDCSRTSNSKGRSGKPPGKQELEGYRSRDKFYGSPITKSEQHRRTAQQQQLTPSDAQRSANSKRVGVKKPVAFSPARVCVSSAVAQRLHPTPAMLPKTVAEELVVHLEASADREPLAMLFKQYCLVGEVRPPPGLALRKLIVLCNNAGITDPRVTQGVIAVLARQVHTATIHDNSNHDQAGCGSGAGAGMGVILLTLEGFLNFVVRVSLKKFHDCDPQEALEQILEKHLLPLVHQADSEPPQLIDPDALQALQGQGDTLVALFCHYCSKEQEEEMTQLGGEYVKPPHGFRLGLAGTNMFAADAGLTKLVSAQQVLVQFDSTLREKNESTLRYTGFLEWLAAMAHQGFSPQDGSHAQVDGWDFPQINNGRDEVFALMKMIESSHETALVMHSRGQAVGDVEAFHKWSESKAAHLNVGAQNEITAISNAAQVSQLLSDECIHEELKELFAFYCHTSTQTRSNVVTRAGYLKMISESGALGRGNLSGALVNIIYEKHVMGKFRKHKSEEGAARKASESLAYVVSSTGPGMTHNSRTAALPLMDFESFIDSIVDVGAAVAEHGTGVQNALGVVKEYMIPNCAGRLTLSEKDALNKLLDTEEMQEVMSCYRQPLQALFIGFAQPHDRDVYQHWSNASQREKDQVTMSFSQLWELAIEARLLPAISRMQLGGILVCATEGVTEQCTYTQFEEVMVRCAQLFAGHAVTTTDQLTAAIVEMFAHMDGSPAVRTVAANIGNTHSGNLRLVIEPSRRPWIKQQRGEAQELHSSLLRLAAPGTRSLNLEAAGSVTDWSVPEYCETMLASPNAHRKGSPPWRASACGWQEREEGDDEFDEAGAHSLQTEDLEESATLENSVNDAPSGSDELASPGQAHGAGSHPVEEEQVADSLHDMSASPDHGGYTTSCPSIADLESEQYVWAGGDADHETPGWATNRSDSDREPPDVMVKDCNMHDE